MRKFKFCMSFPRKMLMRSASLTYSVLCCLIQVRIYCNLCNLFCYYYRSFPVVKAHDVCSTGNVSLIVKLFCLLLVLNLFANAGIHFDRIWVADLTNQDKRSVPGIRYVFGMRESLRANIKINCFHIIVIDLSYLGEFYLN